MKNKEQVIETFNAHGPKLIRMMGGRMIDIDEDKAACIFEFDIGKDFCHSIDVVQGGFITAMLDVAMELEKIALNDEYFVEKKLYPNIDFYSGITLKALGFPSTMFTVLFALARTTGWVAQWNEMVQDPEQRIEIGRAHV